MRGKGGKKKNGRKAEKVGEREEGRESRGKVEGRKGVGKVM